MADNPESLYEHYKKIIKDSRIDIIVEGDFDCEEIENPIKSQFSIERGEIQPSSLGESFYE